MAEIEPLPGTAPDADPQPIDEDDTEGHSFDYEYARTVARERQHAAEGAALKSARLSDRARTRSLFDRIRGR